MNRWTDLATLATLAALLALTEGAPPAIVRADLPPGALRHRLAGGAGLIDQEPVPELRVIAVGIDQGVRAMSGDEFGVTDAAGRATDSRADERCSIPGTSPRRGSRRRPARSRANRALSRQLRLRQICRGPTQDLVLLLQQADPFAGLAQLG